MHRLFQLMQAQQLGGLVPRISWVFHIFSGSWLYQLEQEGTICIDLRPNHSSSGRLFSS
jgi:hypothetical protein